MGQWREMFEQAMALVRELIDVMREHTEVMKEHNKDRV